MVAGWDVEVVCELKFCPVTSVDVERSYKNDIFWLPNTTFYFVLSSAKPIDLRAHKVVFLLLDHCVCRKKKKV